MFKFCSKKRPWFKQIRRHSLKACGCVCTIYTLVLQSKTFLHHYTAHTIIVSEPSQRSPLFFCNINFLRKAKILFLSACIQRGRGVMHRPIELPTMCLVCLVYLHGKLYPVSVPSCCFDPRTLWDTLYMCNINVPQGFFPLAKNKYQINFHARLGLWRW